MRRGAFNYLLKPLDVAQLRANAEKAVESSRLKRVNVELQRRLDERFWLRGSYRRQPANARRDRAAEAHCPDQRQRIDSRRNRHGQGVVAQAIHQNSPRKSKPFVALNCAALSENILESELFGHVKGAFTDASADRIGKFEYAHGGTMFLDEVGDMPLPTQIKLLRRVGKRRDHPRRLEPSDQGQRADPFGHEPQPGGFDHRGHVPQRSLPPAQGVTIRLPTLCERSQDIPILIDYFIRQFSTRHGKQIRGMSPAARRKLLGFDWPGNVRQLRNVVESMVVVDYDGLLDVDDLARGVLRPNGADRRALERLIDGASWQAIDGVGEAIRLRNAPIDGRQPRGSGEDAGNRRADVVSED